MHFQTKSEVAYLGLREAIDNGQLLPGDRIRLDAWANRLGISRIPLREALQRLEAQGLVQIETHRGARVTVPQTQHLVETLLLRSILEPVAAQKALEGISKAGLEELVGELDVHLQNMKDAAEARDIHAYRRHHREFHMTLYRASGLPLIVSAIEAAWAAFPFAATIFQDSSPRLDVHIELLEKIHCQGAEAVSQAIGQHVQATPIPDASHAATRSEAAAGSTVYPRRKVRIRAGSLDCPLRPSARFEA